MSDTHCADCGAEFKPAGCGTGYAVTAAGNRICYECCAKRDRAEMLATGRAVGGPRWVCVHGSLSSGVVSWGAGAASICSSGRTHVRA